MDETKRKKRIVKMRDEEDKRSIAEAIGFEVISLEHVCIIVFIITDLMTCRQ